MHGVGGGRKRVRKGTTKAVETRSKSMKNITPLFYTLKLTKHQDMEPLIRMPGVQGL